MKILAIETSCDETAVSIVECTGDLASPHFEVLAESLISQVALHAEFGGVVPNLAKREHAKNLVPLLKEALAKAGLPSKSRQAFSEKEAADIRELCAREPELAENIISELDGVAIPAVDLIAVTQGPGLEPALWVGINFAKALKGIWNIPAIGINHMEGHIVSALAHDAKGKGGLEFPAIALLISGGHTELVLAEQFGKYRIVGQTKDDAVGEAYDKVARILDLPYPGGPEVARLAEIAREENADGGSKKISTRRPLPRPMISTPDFDFSFSGLKTAVLYAVRDIKKMENVDDTASPETTEGWKKEIALEFEEAASDVLLAKTEKAIEKFGAKTLIVGGGVIANAYIRGRLEALGHEGLAVRIPEIRLATDNATMIAFAASIATLAGSAVPLENGSKAQGNLAFER